MVPVHLPRSHLRECRSPPGEKVSDTAHMEKQSVPVAWDNRKTLLGNQMLGRRCPMGHDSISIYHLQK